MFYARCCAASANLHTSYFSYSPFASQSQSAVEPFFLFFFSILRHTRRAHISVSLATWFNIVVVVLVIWSAIFGIWTIILIDSMRIFRVRRLTVHECGLFHSPHSHLRFVFLLSAACRRVDVTYVGTFLTTCTWCSWDGSDGKRLKRKSWWVNLIGKDHSWCS
jgi:hypothetical protein